MKDYYKDKLSSDKLFQVYKIATPRVRQYLREEINFVLKKIRKNDLVLDLGCGYGRVIPFLAKKAGFVIGIDTSPTSIALGKKLLNNISNCHLIKMNAVKMSFEDDTFDMVVCIQNGISAFHVNQKKLIKESIRVTKPGGLILFSSYSENFWEHRLRWFKLQSEAGLLGEIDFKKTKNGKIFCKDGFKATTINKKQFLSLTKGLNVKVKTIEVDSSSLFCEIKKLKKVCK